MRGKITKRTVDALQSGPADAFLWDRDLPGFGIRITAAGIRSYVFQYTHGTARRRMTIGRHGAAWTPAGARREALRLRAEVAAGADPATERREARGAPTVAEFADRFIEEHVEPKLQPSSARSYKNILKLAILPALGRAKLADVTRSDVTRLHLKLRETPTRANRTLATLSKMFTLAERWGLRPDGTNPCRHVERFREGRRERYLSEAELAQLGKTLADAERDGTATRFAIAAIRFLVLTGRRLGEALTLRWEDVDLERGAIRLRNTKTGRKAFPLAPAATQLLANLPRVEGNPFVFPGARPGRPIVALQGVWYRLREPAGLEDVRLHDLRHAYASSAACSGEALTVIGALLGHTTPSMTARYAHLSQDAIRAAADRIGGNMARALKAKSSRTAKRKEARGK